MTGTMFVFLASVILVSVIISILVSTTAIRSPVYRALGPFAAGLAGAAICFVVAYVSFFLLDPDPVSEFDPQVPLYLRTLPITGFSAIFWLPIYMIVFTRLHRQGGAA